MSSSLSPREVLAYLNELGYQNISAQQLKEFMIDLKKLIKHKQQKHSSNNENLPPKPTCHDEIAPEPKKNFKKESTISIKFKTYKPAYDTETDKSRATSTNSVDTTTKASHDHKDTKSHHSECTKSHHKVQFDGNLLVSKASYIIPHNPVKKCKSDPVALFHKYQEGWKRQKAPGEDNHASLRWAIRERMMGQPRVRSETMSAAPSIESIARSRSRASRM